MKKKKTIQNIYIHIYDTDEDNAHAHLDRKEVDRKEGYWAGLLFYFFIYLFFIFFFFNTAQGGENEGDLEERFGGPDKRR